MSAIQGIIGCRRCKGTGLLPSGEPCPRCSTDEDRRYGMSGSGIDPASYEGCCVVDHEGPCPLPPSMHPAGEDCSRILGQGLSGEMQD